MIRIENLSVKYKNDGREFTALSSLTMTIKDGEIFCCLGPSGCGKSTLLYTLSGIIKDYSGSISIDNEDIKIKRPVIGLVLQEYGLMPWKTVYENIELGLIVKRVDKAERKRRVEGMLDNFNLQSIAKSFPSQLSGGQKQRVAICRALVMDPEVLLMDEPFSALDAINREEMQYFLLDLWKRTGVTILLVTHSVEEAVFLGNRVAVMSSSPGSILDIIDVKLAKDRSLRGKPEFAYTCQRIRDILKDGFDHE